MKAFPALLAGFMRAAPVLAIGILLGQCAAGAPAFADDWRLDCKPVKQRRCENVLKMHFEGGVPNRCKVS